MVIVVVNFYPNYSYSSTTIVDIVHNYIIVIAIVQLLYIILIVQLLYIIDSYGSSQLYHS